jgi:hypothetical protein
MHRLSVYFCLCLAVSVWRSSHHGSSAARRPAAVVALPGVHLCLSSFNFQEFFSLILTLDLKAFLASAFCSWDLAPGLFVRLFVK